MDAVEVGLCVEIPDAEGKSHTYRIAHCPPGLDRRAIWLQRDGSERAYRVAVDDHGYWRCNCRDFRYRHVASRHGGCKHIEAGRVVIRNEDLERGIS